MTAQVGIDYTGICATFFCHDGMGNVLLALRGQAARDEIGTWDQGAGAVEFGHTVEDTVRKEVLEEYGTNVYAMEFLGYRNVFRNYCGKPSHWLAMDFLVRVERGREKNTETDETGAPVLDKIEWFRMSELPPLSKMHSQFGKFLGLYRVAIQSRLRTILQTQPEPENAL